MRVTLGQRMVATLGPSRHPGWVYGVSLACPSWFTRSLHAGAGRMGFDWRGKRAGFSLSFDVDLERDVRALPQVVAMMDDAGIKTSFAVVGHWVERFPNEHRCIVDGGHEIVNHTYLHPDNEELCPDRSFDRITRAERADEIRRCDRAIRDVLGVEPIGFRTPHFGNLHLGDVYDILDELGYAYSSSETAPRSPTFGLPFEQRPGLWELPVSTCPQHPFSTFDTWHAFRNPGGWHRRGDSFVRTFCQLLDTAIEHGSYVNLYFDPADMANDERVRLVLDELLARQEDLWIVNYEQLMTHLGARAELCVS